MTHNKDAARALALETLRAGVAQRLAARLVQSLQLADLRAGREPVESRVAREVEARRAVMRMVTERVVGAGTEKEARNG